MSETKAMEIGADDAQLRLATALAGADSVEGVAAAVAEWAAPASEAAFSNMAIFDPESKMVRAVHAGSLDGRIAARWSEFSIETTTPLCDAILASRPILLGSLDDYGARYRTLVPDTEASGLRATASLPLLPPGGDVMGALGFAWTEPQSFTAAQLSRLRLIAGLTAQAVQRVEAAPSTPLTLGRAAALALQETFLPSVPAYSGPLEVAAAYLPASRSPMGGDWFDVFPVEGGTCLVVGDIGGHGVQAAALMAEVRSAIRAYATDDPSPSSVMTRVNLMLCRLHPEATATVVVGVWHADDRTWTRSNAGHPPVLCCEDGHFRFLSPTTGKGVMLGTDSGWQYRDETRHLAPGTVLLHYTDGLIENQRQAITIGMDELLQHASALADRSPQTLVDDVLLWRLSRGPCSDDLCVLAVRTT